MRVRSALYETSAGRLCARSRQSQLHLTAATGAPMRLWPAAEYCSTMVEQYSAAGHSRIGAPVAAVRCNCDCRLRAQSLPADVSYSADRTLIYERRYLVADWCLQPVVHRVDGAAAFASSRGDGLRIFNPRDQRLFAKNMK